MKQRFTAISNSSQRNDFNLQEKFVYFLDGGHAIHVSEKNNRIIQKLIDEYLYVILGGSVLKSVQT